MCSGKNPYRPVEAEVLEVIPETPTIKTIRFRTTEPVSFASGQFVELTIPGMGEAPFTPSSRPHETEVMEVTVMKVGKVTESIHGLKKGNIIGIRGPFGKGYPIDKFKDKDVLVVGGGCGFAPVRSLMYHLFHHRNEIKKLFFRGGCKTPKELLYRNEVEQWAKEKELNIMVTVDRGDDSWNGHVGLVTTIFKEIDMDYGEGIAVVCGPPLMMKFTTMALKKLNFRDENIYLSMEKNMSCGIGKCGHCRIGTYYACKDGPVFTYSQIKDFSGIWD